MGKFNCTAKSGDFPEWVESFYDPHVNDQASAEKAAKEIFDRFNATLRPEEKPRTLTSVVFVGAPSELEIRDTLLTLEELKYRVRREVDGVDSRDAIEAQIRVLRERMTPEIVEKTYEDSESEITVCDFAREAALWLQGRSAEKSLLGIWYRNLDLDEEDEVGDEWSDE